MSHIFKIKGTNGNLFVFEDYIIISRKGVNGFISQGLKGDTTISYDKITGVEFKKPSVLANGYISFILAGTQRVKSRSTFGNTPKILSEDPNTITLRAVNKSRILNIVDAFEHINKKISANSDSYGNEVDPYQEVIKLKNLYDLDIIDKNEYESKKKDLLNL